MIWPAGIQSALETHLVVFIGLRINFPILEDLPSSSKMILLISGLHSHLRRRIARLEA